MNTIFYKKLKTKAKKFIVFHSDDDPYIPLEQVEKLRDYLDAELVVVKGAGHFNLEKGLQFKQFPQLLAKIFE